MTTSIRLAYLIYTTSIKHVYRESVCKVCSSGLILVITFKVFSLVSSYNQHLLMLRILCHLIFIILSPFLILALFIVLRLFYFLINYAIYSYKLRNIPHLRSAAPALRGVFQLDYPIYLLSCMKQEFNGNIPKILFGGPCIRFTSLPIIFFD